MTTELQEEESRTTVPNPNATDSSGFYLRWLAFLASASLVTILVSMRKPILSIYQEYDLQLLQFASLAINRYSIAFLALVPVVVLAKELVPLAPPKKRLIDALIVLLSLLLVVTATWAIFSPLKVLAH